MFLAIQTLPIRNDLMRIKLTATI